MSRYTIVSMHNGNIGSGGSTTKRGEFDNGPDAVAKAQELVDAALLEHFSSSKTAHELMTHYMMRGSEVPMIYGEPRLAFHAYQYAREKANAMFASAA
jgi:hypothetical protein